MPEGFAEMICAAKSDLQEILTDTDYSGRGEASLTEMPAETLKGIVHMPDHSPIRAVLYQEGGLWVAQCLEYDIGAQAADQDILKSRLLAVVKIERQESIERSGSPFAGIGPAPEKFSLMWGQNAHDDDQTAPSRVQNDDADIKIDLRIAA